jgi:hypothetical protein
MAEILKFTFAIILFLFLFLITGEAGGGMPSSLPYQCRVFFPFQVSFFTP